MRKSLLFTKAAFILITLLTSSAFAQQLDTKGDIISGGKTTPNNIAAYTPCPSLTAVDSTYNATLCGSYSPGGSVMNAFGGPSPYRYAWYQNMGYTPIGLPANTSTYTASQARGFWFTSPTTTVITGLRVPTDIGTANQFIYVVKYLATPPTYPTENTNFKVLGKFLNVPGLDTVKCGIPITTGDIIGILGVRGSTAVSTASMSYASGGYATTISGNPVTLYRFMSQTDITTNNLFQLCEGGTGSLARVDVFFGNSISLFNNSGPLNGGNYVCFYADTNGCTSSSTVNVTPAGTITATSNFTCSTGSNGSAMVVPSGGYGAYSYSWSPSGGTSQLATGLGVGSYTCMISDSLGNCASKVVTVGSCTGINSVSNALTPPLSVYPNPSTGIYNIISAVRADIEIFNSIGSKIYSGKIDQGRNNTINLSEQPEGIYYIRIKDSRSSFKIIKN